MSRWQTKKFARQDMTIYVLNISEYQSVLKLDCVAYCINKVLIGQNTTVAIETKTTSSSQCGF